MPSRSLKLVGCVIVAVTALAACGSSGSSSSGTSSGSSPSGGASGSPIKIMATGTLSSPNLSYPQSADGAAAAAAAINKAGGLDGHPIQIISCNDGLDPNKAAACVQQAVDQKVVALVGGIDEFSAQLWPKLHAADIPWLGEIVISADQSTDSLSYPVSAGTIGSFIEAGRLAVEHSGKKVVVIRHQNPQSAYVMGMIDQGVKLAGGRVVKVVTSPIGNPDTSSAAAQVVAAHPDAVGCACNQGDAARLLTSLRQAGFTGPFTAGYPTFTDADLKSLGPLSANTYTASDIRGPDDPKAAQWVSEMKSYKPSAVLDAICASAWIATHIIADLLKGKTSLTSSTLVAALNSAPSLDTRDLTGGVLTFTKPGPLTSAPRVVDLDVLDYVTKSTVRKEITGVFVDPFRTSP